VKGIEFKDGYFGSSLVVTHPDKVGLTARKTKTNLRGLGKAKPALTAAISQYWERHQVMCSYQQQAVSGPAAGWNACRGRRAGSLRVVTGCAGTRE
jgi:hypothetical protein